MYTDNTCIYVLQQFISRRIILELSEKRTDRQTRRSHFKLPVEYSINTKIICYLMVEDVGSVNGPNEAPSQILLKSWESPEFLSFIKENFLCFQLKLCNFLHVSINLGFDSFEIQTDSIKNGSISTTRGNYSAAEGTTLGKNLSVRGLSIHPAI